MERFRQMCVVLSCLFVFSAGTKPNITLQSYPDVVMIACSLPPSVNALKCDLYYGESTQPTLTITPKSKTNGVSCVFYVSKEDFRTNVGKVQRKDVSCDYTLRRGSKSSVSPRSQLYDVTGKTKV